MRARRIRYRRVARSHWPACSLGRLILFPGGTKIGSPLSLRWRCPARSWFASLLPTTSQLTLSASSSASNHQQARFLISLAQPPRHGVINNSNPGTTTALQLHATAITPTRHGLLSRKRADNSVDTRQTTERRRGESPTQYPIFSYPAAGREDSLVLTAVCPRDR